MIKGVNNNSGLQITFFNHNSLPPREAKIRSKGLEILRLIPKRSILDLPTVRYWQDYLLKLSMDSPELRNGLFQLVEKTPNISRPRDLKLVRREIFAGKEIPMPKLVWLGIRGLPATLFYPPYKLTVSSLAKRFIMNENLEEAIVNIQKLQEQGIGVTLDILGESVENEAAAQKNIGQYLKNIEFLSKKLKSGINFSLKFTGISSEVGKRNTGKIKYNLYPILSQIKEVGGFLRIDMEYFSLKDLTLRIFKEILEEREFCNYEDMGIVIQAYLKEAKKDVWDLILWAKERYEKSSVRTALRLVKGAYVETETKLAEELGYPNPLCESKSATDTNFEKIAEILLKHHFYFKLAFGTHNPRSIAAVAGVAEELSIPKKEIEFQMLYGMGEPILKALVKLGYPTRVYAPVGDFKSGLPYLVRRLTENTSNASMLVALQNYLTGRISDGELLQAPQS